MYLITGSGRCNLTGQTVESMEGGRASTDDYIVKQNPTPTGVALELSVRKAARANLDGNITRELAGLKSVAIEDIEEAFRGDPKKGRDRFRQGRGFGSGAERRGAAVEKEWTGKSPECSECGKPMKYVPAGTTKDGKKYDPFWSCTGYPKCKQSLRHGEWLEILAQGEADAKVAQ
jgi:hypothetical protein